MRRSHACALVVLLLLPTLGVINPSFQPRHLHDIYDHVFHARVASVDSRQRLATLEVLDFAKGGFTDRILHLSGDGPQRLAEILALVPGETVVVFAGKSKERRSVRRDALYYVGGGTWHRAQVGEGESFAQWTLLGNADEGKDSGGVEVMKATFNGLVPSLWTMMSDLRAGRGYFPSVPFSRFTAERLADVPEAAGVAVVDLQGTGRLDVVIASPQGTRLLRQQTDGSFIADPGLAAAKARSIAVADVEGDGRPELLLDGTVWHQDAHGGWSATVLIGDLGAVLAGVFVDLDADGRPDVVLSLTAGGVRAFRNQVEAGRATFSDVTEALGLEGLEGVGTLAVGDWNGDGRADLVHLGGVGTIALREDSGFSTHPLPEGEDTWMAGALAPILDQDRDALIVVSGDRKALFTLIDGAVVDVSGAGNEIQDPVPGLHLVAAEDMNADGTVDLYALASESGSPDFLVDNRGYGSFMMPTKYSGRDIIPSVVYNDLAKRGAAVGDVTGDGALDVVLSGADGRVWLLRNRTLEDRPLASAIDTPPDARKQIDTKLLTIVPQGTHGVIGSTVTVHDAEGRLVSRRMIGSQSGQGSAGPLRALIGLRESGAYLLRVRFADGAVVERPIDALATAPRHQTVIVTR